MLLQGNLIIKNKTNCYFQFAFSNNFYEKNCIIENIIFTCWLFDLILNISIAYALFWQNLEKMSSYMWAWDCSHVWEKSYLGVFKNVMERKRRVKVKNNHELFVSIIYYNKPVYTFICNGHASVSKYQFCQKMHILQAPSL